MKYLFQILRLIYKENFNFLFCCNVILVLLIIFCLIFYNNKISSAIERNNKITENTVDSIKVISLATYYKPFIIYPSKTDSNGSFIINERDLQNIKEHINYLTRQVDEAVKKSEEQVQLDIDRLNLYMTVAIGLLGILGVFVPILANYFGREELKSKINAFKKDLRKVYWRLLKMEATAIDSESTINTTDDKIKQFVLEVDSRITSFQQNLEGFNQQINSISTTAQSAQDQVVTASSKIINLEELLLLLISFTKITNLDSVRINFSSDSRKYLLQKFKIIKNNFILCKNAQLNPVNIDQFSDNIIEFVISLELIKRSGVFLRHRDDIEFLNQLITSLNDFPKEITSANLDSKYSAIIISIENLITHLEKN